MAHARLATTFLLADTPCYAIRVSILDGDKRVCAPLSFSGILDWSTVISQIWSCAFRILAFPRQNIWISLSARFEPNTDEFLL